MTTPAELLEPLDWTVYACQCPVCAGKCPNRATHVVAIHALENCNGPDLDPFGNRIQIRCYECTLKLQRHVAHRLAALAMDGPLACPGCGAPVASVSDIVRSVSEL